MLISNPRVFDVQIFQEETDCNADLRDQDCIHPKGWGTILVGGMRFGGTPVTIPYIDGATTKTQPFVSSYFVLDITNPENRPVLLGELTQSNTYDSVDLGYTTSMPTMAINKKNDTDSKWYLVFGSGPHDDGIGPHPEVGMKGESDQQAKVSVLPLNDLIDGLNKPVKGMRLQDKTDFNCLCGDLSAPR